MRLTTLISTIYKIKVSFFRVKNAGPAGASQGENEGYNPSEKQAPEMRLQAKQSSAKRKPKIKKRMAGNIASLRYFFLMDWVGYIRELMPKACLR